MTAQAPKLGAAKIDPRELIQIVLGSESQPPSGMYLAPELKDPATRQKKLDSQKVNSRYPNISKAWESVKKMYPYPAASGEGVFVIPKVLSWLRPGINAVSPSLPFGKEYIGVNPDLETKSPEEIADTLVHELAHVSQYQNQPTFRSRQKSTKDAASTGYFDRPHESQAFETEWARRAINQVLK